MRQRRTRTRPSRATTDRLESRTLFAALSGTVFNDMDLDGVRDAAEPGLSGWWVYIDRGGGGLYTSGLFPDPRALTDADGRYVFENWAGTDDPVRVIPHGGTWVTTPTRPAAAGSVADIGVAAVAPVTGFTLVNADTDETIGPLAHGDTIDLARVGRRLNVRADLGPGPHESVRFNLDGNPDHRVENAAPYALAGDDGGDYRPWTPDVGTHALVATAYRRDDAGGQLGPSHSIVFDVVDSRSRTTPRALRVNAGGRAYVTEAGEPFAADTGFRGGIPRPPTFAVAGTDDDALYASYRYGRSFTFSQPVPSGAYTLRLHFAEPTFDDAGRRQFDVFAEGRRVLRRYDPAADAGYRTAAAKENRVTVTDGKIDLWFRGVIGGAVVSAIELVPVPGAALPTSARVNAGGGAFTDAVGRPFEPERGFAGGRPVRETFDVEGTEDDALFSSYRAGGRFNFSRPVADGNYAVLLEFAEPTAGAAAGSRTFDVSAEGRLALDDYDVVANAGAARTAVAEALHVKVTDGALDLAFAGVTGEAVVSAVVIVPTDVPAAALPYSVECAPEWARETASARNLRRIGQGIVMHANENRGRYPADLETVYRTQDVGHQAFANPRSLTPTPRGELSQVENAGWIDTLEDYVYVGAGLSYRAPGDTPVAYENPDRVKGDLMVLRADGSVQRMDRRAAAERLGFDPDAEPTGARPPADPSDPACQPDPTIVNSAANLRQIFRAMTMHANENRGVYPPDPGSLVLTQDLEPGVFLNPRNHSDVPPAGMTPLEQADWVNAQSGYVYRAANVRTSAGAETILAHENPGEMSEGINLLFADGRVEFREMRWAVETIRRNAG